MRARGIAITQEAALASDTLTSIPPAESGTEIRASPESVARFIFVTAKSHGNMGKHDKDTPVKTPALPSHADNGRGTRETEYYFIPQNTQRSLSKFYRRSTPIREIFRGHCVRAAESPAMQCDP